MPIKQLWPQKRPPSQDPMVRQLAAEWDRPSGNAFPVVVEEMNHRSERVHVYVVWDTWESLDADERSQIILDAAELVFPTVEPITIAMGLTPSEADRIGIDWR